MVLNERKYYIDNLRWIMLLILIPYHTAMAWNSWSEPNYIYFESNNLISSIIVFFSPYFMPVLFLLSGISTRFALQKRTKKEYLIERVKKLLVPFLFGTIVFMPIMTYIADKFNYSYSGGFFEHYVVFFTKYTDLTGADGGFSLGQFWFLLYLIVISVISVGIIFLSEKFVFENKREIPLWIVLISGLPLPFLSDLLSIGGKSLAEYTYLFILGYYVFSNEKIIDKLERKCLLLFFIGMVATIFNIYLFIWSDIEYPLLNDVAKYISEWFMMISLLGLGKRYFDFNGKISRYMSKRSFLVFIYHFVWVVLFEYLLYMIFGNNTAVLFIGTIIFSYFMTFISCEITLKVPFLCFLTGTKYSSYK